DGRRRGAGAAPGHGVQPRPGVGRRAAVLRPVRRGGGRRRRGGPAAVPGGVREGTGRTEHRVRGEARERPARPGAGGGGPGRFAGSPAPPAHAVSEREPMHRRLALLVLVAALAGCSRYTTRGQGPFQKPLPSPYAGNAPQPNKTPLAMNGAATPPTAGAATDD